MSNFFNASMAKAQTLSSLNPEETRFKNSLSILMDERIIPSIQFASEKGKSNIIFNYTSDARYIIIDENPNKTILGLQTILESQEYKTQKLYPLSLKISWD